VDLCGELEKKRRIQSWSFAVGHVMGHPSQKVTFWTLAADSDISDTPQEYPYLIYSAI
jgi:hypothetical protein